MAVEAKPIQHQIQNAQELLKRVKQEINKMVVGQEHLIESLLIGMLLRRSFTS